MISRHTRDPKRLKLAINANMSLLPLKMHAHTGSLANKRPRPFASTHKGATHTPCCTSLTPRPGSALDKRVRPLGAQAPSSSAFNTLMQYMPVETNHQLSNKPVSHPICPRAAPDSGLVRLLISRNRKVVVCFSETRNCRCRVATRLVSPLMSLPVYASHSLALFLSVHTQRKCKGQQSALGHLRREIHQVCRQPHHRDAAPCPWTLRAAVLFM